MSSTQTAASTAKPAPTYDYSDLTSREHWVKSVGAFSVGQIVRAVKWAGTWKISRILESDGDVPKMHPYELEAVLEPWDTYGAPVIIWAMAEALTLVAA